jgi:acetyl esterase/lipase
MASLQTHLFRFLIRRMNMFGREGFDLKRFRRRSNRLGTIAPVHRKVQISPLEANGVAGEWHELEGAPADRALLYLHGGAWMIGSAAMYRHFVSRLAYYSGINALVIDYRLAPEHPFPAGLDDCLAAFEYLVERGIGPEKIVVAGDSAGGNLTLALLLARRDHGLPLPGAAVGISPATDLTRSSPSQQTRAKVDPFFGGHELGFVVQQYAIDHPPDHHLISPLQAELSGLPPLLLHVGDHEVLLDDAVLFAEKARSAGVEVQLKVWPEMFHVFQIFDPMLPEARVANREIVEFIRAHLA